MGESRLDSLALLHVVGARPNFMKIAPVLNATDSDRGWKNVLVHSGQHYDAIMSEAFFDDLNIRAPDWNLAVGSGTHAAQTAGVLARLEAVLDKEQPDLVIVVGDVNSTLAAALCAAAFERAHRDRGVEAEEAGLDLMVGMNDQERAVRQSPSDGRVVVQDAQPHAHLRGCNLSSCVRHPAGTLGEAFVADENAAGHTRQPAPHRLGPRERATKS